MIKYQQVRNIEVHVSQNDPQEYLLSQTRKIVAISKSRQQQPMKRLVQLPCTECITEFTEMSESQLQNEINTDDFLNWPDSDSRDSSPKPSPEDNPEDLHDENEKSRELSNNVITEQKTPDTSKVSSQVTY